ncbi:unnamed protein product, partial [Enterobius vermicularis]|uniref:Methyltransf_11 domain-containing protein n=1 Tax=Enterobius vermicularis TaxID=51028 RepID=A0A0N4UVG6_ENTVE
RRQQQRKNFAAAVFFSTAYYNITGLSGVVVGSRSPWVEAICLRNGAKKVEFRYEGKFDFIISFSSIEHSGLGRYGDPLDPIGDIREMQKIWCLLKDNGLVFLGLPTGIDSIYFNVHRIYGEIRLPMMFEGFDLLDIFYGRNPNPINLCTQYFHVNCGSQYVYVLRKQKSS